MHPRRGKATEADNRSNGSICSDSAELIEYGDKIRYGINISQGTKTREDGQLQDLRLHTKPNYLFMTYLEDTVPSVLEVLADNAANGRQALVENVTLATDLEALTKSKAKKPKAKKSKSQVSHVDPATTSGDSLTEILKVVQELKEEVTELKRKGTNQEKKLEEYGKDKENLEKEVTKLQKEPLNLRIVLEQARRKLLKDFNIDADAYRGRLDDLVALVQTLLPKAKIPSNPQYIPNAASLSAPDHLDLILRTSSIRLDGNSAAHEADLPDLAEAVLQADLSRRDRQMMIDIFTYTYGVPPMHRKAASNAS
ncbi:hypothetical protein C0991_008444 [Blastosporella zonata]|nr:hypothetical protein C0991_008444 [Blastosporella zonata]